MDEHTQFLDAIPDAALDGLIALSGSAEKPYATAVYSMLFPGWEKLRYNDPLDVVRDFYAQYISDVDDFIALVAEVRRTRELREGRMHLLDGRILHVIGRAVKTRGDGEQMAARKSGTPGRAGGFPVLSVFLCGSLSIRRKVFT
jgi:hypothetical protein